MNYCEEKNILKRIKIIYERYFIWNYWCYNITDYPEQKRRDYHFRTKWQHFSDKIFNRSYYLKKYQENE